MSAIEEKQSESPVTIIEASQLVFLNAKKLRFFMRGATLRLTVEEDRSYLKVSVLRAFPLSEPDRFLSVRDGDNKEVGLIVNPEELDLENRRLVDQELDRRYFAPIITRIVAAKERFGTVDWTVETNRGKCRFTTRNLRENVQRPSPSRIIINDVDGNRYDICNLDAMSLASQELLFRHI
jgi:hypothetical protein